MCKVYICTAHLDASSLAYVLEWYAGTFTVVVPDSRSSFDLNAGMLFAVYL